MSREYTAICDRALDSEAPEWVHLLPSGPMEGRDGRTFDLSDPSAVIAAFNAGGIDLPIDYEHQNDKPTGNGPVPAAGWIKELRNAADGLWGRVTWTATARELIASKAYRYLSPSIIYRADNKAIVKLKGAGLVHNPNLHLTALANQEDKMSDTMTLPQKLAAMLNLAPDATDDEIMAAFEKKIGTSDTPDPSKFVPIEAMQEALRDRNHKAASMSESRAQAKVKDAMDNGYISPGMRDWATALCQQDETSFDAFIAGAVPQFAHLMKPSAMTGQPPSALNATGDEADQSDLAASVCRQLGLKPGTLNS